MKKYLLTLSLALITVTCFSQSGIYYKALLLKSQYSPITKKITVDDNVYNALKDLFPSNNSKDSVIAQMNRNPFLLKMFVPQAGAAATTPLNFVASAVGGLDVTNIANGIADLLIDRAKQELTIAFFDRFKKFASDPQHPEFITLFPQTTDKLDSLLSYNYPAMLPQLRSAFLADLKQAPYHLEAVLALSKYQPLLAKFPEIKIAIKSLQIVRDLQNGASNAADVLKTFATDTAFNWKDASMSKTYRNTGSLINLSYIISESLRRDTVKNRDSIWVSGKQIRALVTDNTLATIYMGLIYQQISSQKLVYYTAKGTDSLATLFANQKKNILLFQNKIAEFISLTSEVNNAIANNNAKKAAKQALTNDDYYNYINTSLDAINYVFSMVKVIDTNFNTNNILSIPIKANSLYKDIYTKQYNQAVSDGFDILTQLKVLADASPNYTASKNDKLDSLLTFVAKVKPYAIFMANVVTATSSADVEAAINNAILPVGSYTIKQRAVWNFSVNGYLGYAFDFNKIGFSDVYAKGIYAPVGISLTHAFTYFSNKTERYIPITAFVSIIDVGSVVSYRLSNGSAPAATTTNADGTTTSSMQQEIKLGSIFSPSAQIFWSISKTPFAVGAGWRRTPTLFYSGGTSYTTIGAKSVFNVALLLDIPFFTLKNTPLKQ